MGDMMNDMHAQQKLRNNLQILGECEQIASVQFSAVQSVVNSIRTRLHSIEGELSRIKQAIQAERKSIFDAVSSHPGAREEQLN